MIKPQKYLLQKRPKMLSATAKGLSFKCSQLYPATATAFFFLNKRHSLMDSRTTPTPHPVAFSRSSSSSILSPPIPTAIPTGPANGNVEPTTLSLHEWQSWGTDSPIPVIVQGIVNDMKLLERENDAQMSFGGLGGKLKGDFKVKEDKKHRAKYQALSDSEEKLQFFAARQIACRVLGSRTYLCHTCWLPAEDCMCSRVVRCSLWHHLRFWIYMHPKDFVRQNNTGKLLWQVFGVQAATLCLFGIPEHEEIMWDAFRQTGKNKVWCLYPNKNAPTKSVQDSFVKKLSSEPVPTDQDETMNFILIDGTWSNSAAMFRRLQDQAQSVWEDDLPCISLTTGASAMHRLRPQPSWDRTCTAAAAVGLLSELHSVPEFSAFELEKQAEALEDGLDLLLEALTARRVRMGRSIRRRERHHNDIC